MRQTMLRLFGSAVATTVVAGGLVLGSAGAAQATVVQCIAVLNNSGYAYTPTRGEACQQGEGGKVLGCKITLQFNDVVDGPTAEKACHWAAVRP